MEAKELREVLKQREKRTLEYKRAWDNVPGNLFETICAFLNREGGLIVLGAEDNGEIKKGVSPDAAYQMCRDISNMSNNPQKLSPTFLLQPEEVEIDGKKVIANMLVHREYLNPTFTTIEIGREGIVIKNANKPLHSGPVTLRNYVRHPKNPHISNFFVQMGRAEYLGTGIRNLYKYVPIYTGGEPEIIEGDVFEVRMKLPKGFWSGEEKETESVMGNDVIENVIENVIEKRGIKKSQLTTRQLGIIQRLIETGKKYVPGVVLENVPENVLENVQENDIVNNVETLESLAAMCGRSTRTIHRDIVGLKELGLVRRDGGDLGGIWVVLTSEGMK